MTEHLDKIVALLLSKDSTNVGLALQILSSDDTGNDAKDVLQHIYHKAVREFTRYIDEKEQQRAFSATSAHAFMMGNIMVRGNWNRDISTLATLQLKLDLELRYEDNVYTIGTEGHTCHFWCSRINGYDYMSVNMDDLIVKIEFMKDIHRMLVVTIPHTETWHKAMLEPIATIQSIIHSL